MDLLINAIIFALPSWVANMLFSLIVPLKRWFPFLARIDRPIDGGAKFMGQPIFGDKRNYGGLVVAILVSLSWWLVSGAWVVMIQILLTFVGTLVGSFIKRRLRFESGRMLPIIDQVDYMVVVGLVWYISGLQSAAVIFVALIVTLIGQPAVSLLGYLLKLKERPY